MSWIREEDLGLPNVIKVMSFSLRAMRVGPYLGSATTFGGPTLTRVQEEAIATTVSIVNSCRF